MSKGPKLPRGGVGGAEMLSGAVLRRTFEKCYNCYKGTTLCM